MTHGIHLVAFSAMATLALLSPASATCLAAGSAIVAPSQDPCHAVGHHGAAANRPLAFKAAGAGKLRSPTPDPGDDGEDDDVSASLPLADGVDMSGRLGPLRAGDVNGATLDDGWRKRPSSLPRTRLTSENGLRIAGPQALKKRTGDGASIGLTFDLPP